jgi:hypothetical protein
MIYMFAIFPSARLMREDVSTTQIDWLLFLSFFSTRNPGCSFRGAGVIAVRWQAGGILSVDDQHFPLTLLSLQQPVCGPIPKNGAR